MQVLVPMLVAVLGYRSPQPESTDASSVMSEPTAVLPAPTTLPAPAPAQDDDFELSYTYVELGYGTTDLDEVDDDTDEIYGRASLGLFGFLHAFLDYKNSSTDFEDTDSDLWGLGVGGHFGVLEERLDLIGEVEWLYADLSSDIDDLDDSDSGWSAFAGARWLALPWDRGGLEVNGGYRFIDLEALYSDDSINAWEIGTRLHFLKLFSVGAKYQMLEDDDFLGVDARVSFGT